MSLALPPQVPVDMDQPTKQTESMLRNQSDGQKLMRTVHRSTLLNHFIDFIWNSPFLFHILVLCPAKLAA